MTNQSLRDFLKRIQTKGVKLRSQLYVSNLKYAGNMDAYLEVLRLLMTDILTDIDYLSGRLEEESVKDDE